MKRLIIGNGSLGIASHITHAQTIDSKPIIIIGEKEEKGINTELPKLMQNVIEDAEKFKLTEFGEHLSGREKRRQRRKQERKRK